MLRFFCLVFLGMSVCSIQPIRVVAESFRQKLQQNVERYKHNNFRWNTRSRNDNSILSVRQLEERKDQEFRKYLDQLRRNDEYLLSMKQNYEWSLKQRRHPSRMCYSCNQEQSIPNHSPSLPMNEMGYYDRKCSEEKVRRPQSKNDSLHLLNVIKYYKNNNLQSMMFDDKLQSIMFDDKLQSIMFDDKLQSMMFDDKLQSMKFDDKLQSMMFDDKLQSMMFNDKLQSMMFDDKQQSIMIDDKLQSMMFDDKLQSMMFDDKLPSMMFDDKLQSMMFDDKLQSMMFDDKLQSMMFDDKLQSMMFDDKLQSMMFDDKLQSMMFDDKLLSMKFDDKLQSMMFDDKLQSMKFADKLQSMMFDDKLQSMKFDDKLQSMMFDDKLQSMMFNDKLHFMMFDDKQSMFDNDQKEVDNLCKDFLTEQKTENISLNSIQFAPLKEITHVREDCNWINMLETLVKEVPEKSEDFFRNWSNTISVLGDHHESRQQFKRKFRSYGINTIIKEMASSSIFEKLFWPFVYDNGFMNQKLGLLGLSNKSSNSGNQKLLFYETLEKYQTLKIPISDKIVYSFNDPVFVEGLNRSGLVEMSRGYVESGLHLYTQEEQTELLKKVDAAMNMINNSMPNLYRVIHQVVGSIAFYKAQHGGFAGGSISSALGVIWQDPRAYREQSVAHYAEQIVHEFIHTSLFLADLVHGTFTDFNLLSRAKVYSPIRHELRDFDKAFHASYVSTGVALFHARAGNWGKAHKLLKPLRTSVDGLVKVNRELGVLNDSGNAMLQALDDFLTIIRLT